MDSYDSLWTNTKDWFKRLFKLGKKKDLCIAQLIDIVNDFNQYKAKIKYVGYMPNAYSLFADRPVASVTGGMFDSTMTKLTDTDVSLGFDYVFVSGNGTTVTIRIEIYDNEDHLISLSDPITIPSKPDHHTIVKGRFMTQDTSNGVDIDTGFGGDYNIIL